MNRQTAAEASLLQLRAWLETQGFTIVGATNPRTADQQPWYAWRELGAEARECQSNEKPPVLILTPYLLATDGRQFANLEVTITGMYQEWFKLEAYGLNVEDFPGRLGAIQDTLVRAWNSLSDGQASNPHAGKM